MAEVGRLVLGTAAIGLAYGLPADGRPPQAPPEAEAHALLRHAWSRGIRAFDTAPAYGSAEARCAILDAAAEMWTKLDASVLVAADPAAAARASLMASLARLRRPSVTLLQWHNWSAHLADDARFRAAWDALAREPGAQALGATTYGPEDARAAVLCGRFRVVQVEWNLLNQAAVDAVADLARARGVRIAVRSVLLQGVLTERGRDLPSRLSGLTSARARAQALADRLGLPLAALALRAALLHPAIDRVLIGADRPGEVDAHLASAVDAGALPWDAVVALHAPDAPTDPRRWAPA